jgi:hypothetical protein
LVNALEAPHSAQPLRIGDRDLRLTDESVYDFRWQVPVVLSAILLGEPEPKDCKRGGGS